MKKNIWGRVFQILYPLALYYVVYHLIYYILRMMVGVSIGSLWCLGIAAIITIIPMYSVYKALPIVRAKSFFDRSQIGKEILGILLIVILGIALNVLLTQTGFTNDSSFQTANATLSAGDLFTRILVTAIVIPILEEMTFRGCVCGQLFVWSNTAVAVIISAVLFGIFHSNIVQAVYGCLMGIALGIFYCKTNKLWPVVMAHGLTNLVVILYTYL